MTAMVIDFLKGRCARDWAPAISGQQKPDIFSINFTRREFLPCYTRRFLIYLGAVYLTLHAIVLSIFIVMSILSHIQQTYLEKTIKGKLTAGAETFSDLKRQLNEQHQEAMTEWGQLQAVVSLKQERFPLASKWGGITRTLPPRTWVGKLQGLHQGELPVMTISANYLIDPEDPYRLPDKAWIEKLREDSAFGKNLKEVELKNSSQTRVGSAEVYSFVLRAVWTREPSESSKGAA